MVLQSWSLDFNSMLNSMALMICTGTWNSCFSLQLSQQPAGDAVTQVVALAHLGGYLASGLSKLYVSAAFKAHYSSGTCGRADQLSGFLSVHTQAAAAVFRAATVPHLAVYYVSSKQTKNFRFSQRTGFMWHTHTHTGFFWYPVMEPFVLVGTERESEHTKETFS